MKTLGLLGGVASGKSLVSGQLADLGAVVLDADRAGHEALRLPCVEEAARQRWGNKVFGPDGHVDRRSLAKIVFAPPPDGPKERKFLEDLTHPEIGRRLLAQVEALKGGSLPSFNPEPTATAGTGTTQGAVAGGSGLNDKDTADPRPTTGGTAPPLAVLDAALILEAGWDKLCDYLVLIDVPNEMRMARALKRGWTEEDFAAREAAQESLDCKRPRADLIIDNSGSAEHTQAQVQRLWQFLVG